MLLRFRFSNFRSFREEQELSLVAASNLREPGPTAIVHPLTTKDGILPVAAIYGANASGKTNVVRALLFASRAVRNSHSRWEPDRPIRIDQFVESKKEGTTSSRFEFDFLLGGVRHSYGFCLDSALILEEWLYAYPNSKKQSWFQRHHGKPISFSAKLPGANRVIEGITRKNSLFLSAAAQNNHEILTPIFERVSGLRFVRDTKKGREESSVLATDVFSEPRLAEAAMQLLRAADIGIVGFEVERVGGKTTNEVTSSASDRQALGSQPDGLDRIRLLHRIGEEMVPFTTESESAGTVAYLLVVSPVLKALNGGATLCIDELGASLHPLLANQIIRLFNDPSSNRKGAQLIFNTHDATLLSRANLRRDQIWFTEKSKDGASHLYPLTDFKPRQNENLENGYLQGRYGAIPFLNPRAFLTERTDGKA
ncbi:MAG TPA: AAA family ATPase [Bryobacteraceae bacterium]|jgi:hypothetical protein